MTYEATWLLLASLPPAGAAACAVRGAGVQDLALPPSHLHGKDANYTCQLVEGLLPYGYACDLRVAFAVMPASRRARCLPCLHSHTPHSSSACPLLLLHKDQSSFRGSVHEQWRAA
jgi:hypothetical protein